MNLPNKLTILRVILIPFFVFFYLYGGGELKWNLLALLIFVIASITDFLDGNIARKYNLVTNFGKFMDPLADKLLVCSALICFVSTGKIMDWIVIIIISREFIISGFRLIACEQGIVIAAGLWGKLKTICQMIMIIVLIADLPLPFWNILGNILIWISLGLTIISLIDYIYKNKAVLSQKGN